jgi:outer membrane protein TolC
LRSRQQVQAARISTVVNVSKAYYDILLTQEQVRVFDEAIIRLEKQLADARSQYEHGTVDKIDYRRATIALGNARSGRRGAEESVKFKKAFLSELMGHGAGAALQLAYDPKAMEGETLADTLQRVAPAERIEYQQLQTERGLQQLDVRYQQWRLLPTVWAFVNYNLVYQDNQFARLFDRSFPTSVVGVSAAVPLFQGGQRLQQLRRSRLVGKRLGVEMENVRQRINTEYEQALATYKSALNEWQTTRQNIALAREVYDVLKLQYDEGIKTYLELIVAETDLRTTQLDYYNALYRVLAGKLDLQRALGTIDVD